jgi:hypothetical protein
MRSVLLRCLVTVSALIATMSLTTTAKAEPTAGALPITYIRPYGGTNIVYFATSAQGLCGAQGATGYYIDTSALNGKSLYAALLLAYSLGKSISIELSNSTACSMAGSGANFAVQVQSIYLR